MIITARGARQAPLPMFGAAGYFWGSKDLMWELIHPSGVRMVYVADDFIVVQVGHGSIPERSYPTDTLAMAHALYARALQEVWHAQVTQQPSHP